MSVLCRIYEKNITFQTPCSIESVAISQGDKELGPATFHLSVWNFKVSVEVGKAFNESLLEVLIRCVSTIGNGETVVRLFTDREGTIAVLKLDGLFTTHGVEGLLSKDGAGVDGKFIHHVLFGRTDEGNCILVVRNCGT